MAEKRPLEGREEAERKYCYIDDANLATLSRHSSGKMLELYSEESDNSDAELATGFIKYLVVKYKGTFGVGITKLSDKKVPYKVLQQLGKVLKRCTKLVHLEFRHMYITDANLLGSLIFRYRTLPQKRLLQDVHGDGILRRLLFIDCRFKGEEAVKFLELLVDKFLLVQEVAELEFPLNSSCINSMALLLRKMTNLRRLTLDLSNYITISYDSLSAFRTMLMYFGQTSCVRELRLKLINRESVPLNLGDYIDDVEEIYAKLDAWVAILDGFPLLEHLAFHNLSVKDAIKFATGFKAGKNFPRISTLEFDQQFDNGVLNAIKPVLAHFPNLSVIKINHERLNNEGAIILAGIISEQKSIKHVFFTFEGGGLKIGEMFGLINVVGKRLNRNMLRIEKGGKPSGDRIVNFEPDVKQIFDKLIETYDYGEMLKIEALDWYYEWGGGLTALLSGAVFKAVRFSETERKCFNFFYRFLLDENKFKTVRTLFEWKELQAVPLLKAIEFWKDVFTVDFKFKSSFQRIVVIGTIIMELLTRKIERVLMTTNKIWSVPRNQKDEDNLFDLEDLRSFIEVVMQRV